jgi:flagella basal body P-ring formation protein FlgA
MFLQAQVSVVADYVAAAVPLAQGQAIDAGQLATMQGDIAAMPNGIITDMAQAIGRTPTVSLPAGTPLRLDALKSKPVVQQNQAVRIVSRGENFSVSGEGKAIGNAGDGQVVQVRTPRGALSAARRGPAALSKWRCKNRLARCDRHRAPVLARPGPRGRWYQSSVRQQEGRTHQGGHRGWPLPSQFRESGGRPVGYGARPATFPQTIDSQWSLHPQAQPCATNSK